MSDVKWVSVPSAFIFSGELRLDAEFYSRERLKAHILIDELKKSGISIGLIEDFSEKIFHRPRFRRNYVSKNEGDPYLMPNEIFLFPLKARKFIKDYPEGLKIEPDWILITCSGSVGRIRISDRVLSTYVMSHDLIRVIPKDKSSLGYIYAYLNTWIGQAFLTKTNYGGPIKHIEPHHVANIPIPIVDEDIMKKVNSRILEAHKMREEAQLKLLEAEKLFYTELSLPEIDENSVEYFGGDLGRKVKAFTVKASELDLRLDASYHIPLVRKVLDELSKSNLTIVPMQSILARAYVPPRFKRIYVKPEMGVPFLLPIHSVLVKYFDIKYLWKPLAEKPEYQLTPGMLLITRSGTLGRVMLVTEHISSWAASDDFIYTIPREDINPGYLVIFLQSVYGQAQIIRETYGGVIKHLEEFHITKIKLPLPDKSTQDKIGNLVIEAYELKDKANLLEQEAISMLERHLEELSGVSL
ncbi:restriction endonuclease subunit S [Thermococcus nautili]|uniref:Type I restriction modification DNA specificity domain-containing protein n=1 Tax=Thermococcus nautili TaxID=195522 RepID=W8PHZ9_9EURY|nr:restriction endonuclease subunit S [Thermococcus nautili]AHL21719.1 hypothetical protein BD01_0088 [Thermococcus nautili]